MTSSGPKGSECAIESIPLRNYFGLIRSPPAERSGKWGITIGFLPASRQAGKKKSAAALFGSRLSVPGWLLGGHRFVGAVGGTARQAEAARLAAEAL